MNPNFGFPPNRSNILLAVKFDQKLRRIYHGKKTTLHVPVINGRYCFIQSSQINNLPCKIQHVNLNTVNDKHELHAHEKQLHGYGECRKSYHIHLALSSLEI